MSSPFGVALGPDTGRIYWANRSANKISYANLDGSGGGDLNTAGATVENPTAVAIDPVTRRIYWTNPTAKTIAFASLNGGGGGLLNTAGATVSYPDGLAIDRTAGKIYWSSGGRAAISTANIDGSDGAHDIGGGGGEIGGPEYLALLEVPATSRAPAVAGGDAPGSTLSCSPGSWAPDVPPSFLYLAPHTIALQWSWDGQPIPGATAGSFRAVIPGAYRCTATASNAAGSTSQTSAVHTIASSATKPALSAVHETNSVFAVAPGATPLGGTAAAKRHKRGKVFSFRLDQAATTTIAIQARTGGRRVGRQCRAPSRRLAHRPRCPRTITAAMLIRTAHGGLNTIPFSGRIRRTALRPGRYQAVFTASDAAGSSGTVTLRFTIVKR